MTTEHFQKMRPQELQRYLDRSLPTLGERVRKFETEVKRAQSQLQEDGSYVDGPFRITDKVELDQVEDVIDILYDTLAKGRDIGVDILRQLGTPQSELDEITNRLDVLLTE